MHFHDHIIVLQGSYLLSLCLCSLRVYLSLDKSEFNSHYLGLHTCLVKPMRFIQLKIEMGSDQGIKFWLRWFDLSRVAFHGLFPHRLLQLPPSAGPFPWLAFRFFLTCGGTYAPCPTPRKQETPWYEARPPWRASGNGTIRPLNDSNF